MVKALILSSRRWLFSALGSAILFISINNLRNSSVLNYVYVETLNPDDSSKNINILRDWKLYKYKKDLVSNW